MLRLTLPVKDAGEYEVICHFCKAADYGRFSIQVGEAPAQEVDLYHDGVAPSGPVSLGRATMSAGNNPLVVKVTGKAGGSTGYLFGLDAVELKPVK